MKTKKAPIKIIKHNQALRFFTWGLFAFFMVNTFFVFIFLEVEREIIKHEVKRTILSKLPDNQLVSVEQDADFEHNEFELNGIMYDVVSKIKMPDKTILLCYTDNKETLLNQKIGNLIEQDSANNPLRKAQKKLIVFLQQTYIFTDSVNFNFYPQSADSQLFIYTKHFFSTFIFIASPPPKF